MPQNLAGRQDGNVCPPVPALCWSRAVPWGINSLARITLHMSGVLGRSSKVSHAQRVRNYSLPGRKGQPHLEQLRTGCTLKSWLPQQWLKGRVG